MLVALGRALGFLTYVAYQIRTPTEAYDLEAQMVHLAWRVQHGEVLYPAGRDGPHVVVTWSEFCGTQVNKPEKTGFGMKLITRETVYTLGGHSDIEFAPDGLKVTLRFPGEEKGVGE